MIWSVRFQYTELLAMAESCWHIQVAQLEAEVRALQEHAQGNMEAQQADDNMSHAAEVCHFPDSSTRF